MSNIQIREVVGVGLGVAGLIAAWRLFASRASAVEKQGLGIVSGVLLVAATVTLVNRFDETVGDVQNLLS